MVNNTWSLPVYYPIARLWNKYGTEFLSVLQEPDVRDFSGNLIKTGEQLKQKSFSLYLIP